jgi:hypothetical protein
MYVDGDYKSWSCLDRATDGGKLVWIFYGKGERCIRPPWYVEKRQYCHRATVPSDLADSHQVHHGQHHSVSQIPMARCAENDDYSCVLKRNIDAAEISAASQKSNRRISHIGSEFRDVNSHSAKRRCAILRLSQICFEGSR